MQGTPVLSLFLIGLFSGVHCAGMCGGIVGALSLPSTINQTAQPLHFHANIQHAPLSLMARVLSYNAGRISSYVLAGLLVGTLGYFSVRFASVASIVIPVQTTLRMLANGLLMALGLYLLGWWQGILKLENVGKRLWQTIQPLTQRVLPINTRLRAFQAGALWGWLPCGLVYSALFSALATAHPVQGGMLMLAFGLGTLPNLLLLGGAFGALTGKLGGDRIASAAIWFRHPRLRMIAGGSIFLFGLLGLLRLHALVDLPGLSALCL